MTKRFGFLLCTAAVAFGLGSGSANAAVLNLNGTINSGMFGNSGIGSGQFNDTLTFTVQRAGDFTATLTSSASQVGSSGDLDFTNLVVSGAESPLNFKIINNGGRTGKTDRATISGFLNAGTYTLTVSGNSFGNSQFGGSTSLVAAVPETSVWIMMVAGFGVIGAVARNRRLRSQLSFG